MKGFVLLSLDPFIFLWTRSLSQTNISSHLLLDSLIDRPTRILKDNIYHRENTNRNDNLQTPRWILLDL